MRRSQEQEGHESIGEVGWGGVGQGLGQAGGEGEPAPFQSARPPYFSFPPSLKVAFPDDTSAEGDGASLPFQLSCSECPRPVFCRLTL